MSEDMNAVPSTEMGKIASLLRNRLIAGLFIVIPVLVTIWLAWWGISMLTDWAVNAYEQYGKWKFSGWEIALRTATILMLVAGLIVVGQLAKITIGKKLISLMQAAMLKLPILRIVYSTCSQIGETVKTSQKGLFKQVAMFQYPCKGSYAIGFITNDNETKFEVNEKIGEDVYSIFMPTTPNPTSGFLMFIPKKECILLEMPVSEAMTLIVSGGVILPGTKKNAMQK